MMPEIKYNLLYLQYVLQTIDIYIKLFVNDNVLFIFQENI